MLGCNNDSYGLWGCGEYYASLPYGYNSQGVERSGLAQLPFFQGDFQFIERDIDVMFDDDGDEYGAKITNLERITGRKEKLPIVYRHQNKNVLETKWNKNYKSSPKNVPYRGYQDPEEIDWSQYGPDRPTKRKNKKEYAASSTSFENSFVAKFSFFGLLLPGILGTLFFLGVPIAKVYLAGASLVTMYFMTGEGKALEDESLMTSVLLNILESLDTLPVEKKARQLLSHPPLCLDPSYLESEISGVICGEHFLGLITSHPMINIKESCRRGDIQNIISRIVTTLTRIFSQC